MQVFTTLVQSDLRKMPAEVQRIETAGCSGVATQENHHDPFLPPDVIQDIQKIDTQFDGFVGQ